MLIVPLLDQGGLERVCALTANLLSEIFEVHLVVFNTAGMIYDVSGVDLIDLKLGAVSGRIGKVFNLLRRAMRLSKLQKDLDIQVTYSFGRTANLANALSARRQGKTKIKKIAACHSFGEINDRSDMRLIIKRTDQVLCCSKAMAEEVKRLYGAQDVLAIWNPCDIEGIRLKMGNGIPEQYKELFCDDEQRIVSMGRQDDVKGFWHLIKAFRRVQEEHPDTRLVIVGEGGFEEYQELARALGILPKVTFTGMQRDPFPFLASGRIYVLSSISEGLPNALVEALAAGLAVVSVNCRSGPAEILHGDWEQVQDLRTTVHADHGILTPPLSPDKDLRVEMEGGRVCLEKEEEELAQAISELLEDRTLCQRYREKAVERALDFSMERYKEAIVGLIRA